MCYDYNLLDFLEKLLTYPSLSRKFCAKLFWATSNANLLSDVAWFAKNVTVSSNSCDGLLENLGRTTVSPRILLFASSLGPRILLNGSSVLLEIRGGKEEAMR